MAGKKSLRPVAKKSAMASSEAGRELSAFMMKSLPGTGVQGKFGNLSFSVGERVFGFTRGEGAVVLKLPAERVAELVEKRGAALLVMGKRAMKEWTVLEYGPGGWKDELKLFREAMEFVGGLSDKKR